MAGGVIGALLVLALVAVGYCVHHKQLFVMQADSELKARLLRDSMFELEELKRVWIIQPSDLILSRFIDDGAYGEVRNIFLQNGNIYSNGRLPRS